jgi:hypothetical protein
MAHVPLALSVHSFIDKVGADVGFASIIGLAILVLLYFAQARETSTLRNGAEEAEERVRQLEAQVAHLGRVQASLPQVAPAQPVAAPPGTTVQPAVRPVPVTAGASVPGRAAAVAASAVAAPAVAAPAGVGAPALAAATRLIPISMPAPTGAAAATAAPPVASTPPSPPAPVPAPAPATAAGANGSGGSPLPPPPAPAFAPPPPRVQLRPGGAADTGRRPAPAARRATPGGRSRVGRGLAIVLGALGVAAVVVVLLIVTSSGGKTAKRPGTPTTNAPSATHKPKRPAFAPSSVTVTVLNGTATSGAAAKISGQLGSAGYKPGLTTNAVNQTQTATAVGYLPGHKQAALAVAKALKLSTSSVGPVDSGAQGIACPPSSATTCTADVVVTVGADLANK